MAGGTAGRVAGAGIAGDADRAIGGGASGRFPEAGTDDAGRSAGGGGIGREPGTSARPDAGAGGRAGSGGDGSGFTGANHDTSLVGLGG
jgi:hypothetical protein